MLNYVNFIFQMLIVEGKPVHNALVGGFKGQGKCSELFL